MLTKKLDEARNAFRARDPEASRMVHETRRTHAAEMHGTSGHYIKSFVYGGLDGIITTFAVVAGVAGAELASNIVLILGFANLIADGISMALGDFLSTRAENEFTATERKREEWEVDNFPEGEKHEMVEIYESKGIPRADAELIVEKLAPHRRAWVDVMMREELGIVEDGKPALPNAIVTFVSFLVFGFVPLLTYVFSYIFPAIAPRAFLVACILTGVTLFLLGAAKAWVTRRAWYRAGIEMLLVGGIAAVAAYLIGDVLARFTQ